MFVFDISVIFIIQWKKDIRKLEDQELNIIFVMI